MISRATLSLRLSPPLLPSNARQWRRRRISIIIQASKSGRRGEDDYQSTLEALNSRGRIVPRKSLGQHYMLNSSINDQLSSIAGVVDGDVVLEIGPGTGSLTNVLINAGATIIAVEKDPHMALIVKERFGCSDQLTECAQVESREVGECPQESHMHDFVDDLEYSQAELTFDTSTQASTSNTLMVLQEDITKCHIRSHVSSLLERVDTRGVVKYAKVVSNIPFNISTDVVKQLLPMGDLFSDVIILLQDEAALRLTEFQLHSSEYRPINLFVNFYSDAEYIRKVERTNFFPQPNVDAAVVRFKLKQKSDYPQVTSMNGFFSMVNSAFNGKRKMLRKSLQHICSAQEIEDALRSAGLKATARPQELTLEDFVRLYNSISKYQIHQIP